MSLDKIHLFDDGFNKESKINYKIIDKETIQPSNSNLINNIINCDKSKLTELIDTIIENNLCNIKSSINKSVEEQINSSIHNFYKNDIDLEKELYNTKNLDNKLKKRNYPICQYGDSKEIYYKFKEDNCDYDYFSIDYSYYSSGDSPWEYTTLIFNKMNILEIFKQGGENVERCIKHINIFTPQVLFTLKLLGGFQFYGGHNGSNVFSFQKFIIEYNKHKHYFIDNNLKVENIIKLEKEKYCLEVDKLKKEKQEVEELKEDLISNKEYYEDLQCKFIQFEKDKLKLEEEKQKLGLIKRKLKKMQDEILKEKEEVKQIKKALEENTEIDIDECLSFMDE